VCACGGNTGVFSSRHDWVSGGSPWRTQYFADSLGEACMVATISATVRDSGVTGIGKMVGREDDLRDGIASRRGGATSGP